MEQMEVLKRYCKEVLENFKKSNPEVSWEINEQEVSRVVNLVIQEMKERATNGCAYCSKEEMEGLIIHFMDESDIKDPGEENFKAVIPEEILTDEEKAEIKSQAKKEIQKEQKQADIDKQKELMKKKLLKEEKERIKAETKEKERKDKYEQISLF